MHEVKTPVGTVREVYSPTEGPHRTKAFTEHFIKDLPSLKTMKYIVEATHYEANYEPTRQALAETGEDGIVLNSCFCVPFIQFAKTDAGYMNGLLLWNDYRDEVDSLIRLYFDKFVEGYRILADGPADVIATGDNMDGFMISPPIFKEYAVPFYREVKEGAGRRDFEAYIREVICLLRGRRGFILGMSDNVPPNADFSRVEAVAKLIE